MKQNKCFNKLKNLEKNNSFYLYLTDFLHLTYIKGKSNKAFKYDYLY